MIRHLLLMISAFVDANYVALVMLALGLLWASLTLRLDK